MYFDNIGHGSVSKLILSLKRHHPLLIIGPEFSAEFSMFHIETSSFAVFSSCCGKRPNDTFSICLIY